MSKQKNEVDKLFPEKYCDMCGKFFIPTALWMYKIYFTNQGYKYYCSYKCYRKAGGDNGR